jgi:cytochrome P450
LGVERIVFPAVRALARRQRLSDAVFRFSKWGNPLAAERFSNPYPVYERYRADGEVVYRRSYQQWFVFGYDEVLEVLHSPSTATAPVVERMLPISPYNKLSTQARASFTRWLLVTDPPIHSRLRNAVSRAFAPKRIAACEPLVRTIATDLLAATTGIHSVDVVAEFTAILPIYVIADILGLPRDKWAWLRDASSEIGGMLDPFGIFDPVSMNRTFSELHEYFSKLIGQRRAEPKDDLLSVLASSDSGTLTDDEIVATIGFLMFAGHETTTGFLGNSIVALGEHPEQRELLRQHPEIIDNAVEELLRFDSPAQSSGRIAIADIRIGDITIPKGSTVALMLGAANRDRRRWLDADELRLDRPDPKPISFGHGIHHCLGAALARLETRVALPLVLDAFGDYTVDHDKVIWKRSHTLRGPLRLPIVRGARR